MNSTQRAFILNCCENCGQTLDFDRDKTCPYCGFPNYNYRPPRKVYHKTKSEKKREEKEWNMCCILMLVIFAIMCILGKLLHVK